MKQIKIVTSWMLKLVVNHGHKLKFQISLEQYKKIKKESTKTYLYLINQVLMIVQDFMTSWPMDIFTTKLFQKYPN